MDALNISYDRKRGCLLLCENKPVGHSTFISQWMANMWLLPPCGQEVNIPYSRFQVR